MHAETERQMIASFWPVGCELVGPLDYLVIAITRDIPHGELVAFPDSLTANGDVLKRGTFHMRDRCLPPYRFGAEVRDQCLVIAKLAVFVGK